MNPSTTPLPLRLFAATALALLVAMPTGVNAVNALKIDLTAGSNLSTIDRTWTYNLGPTGMRGWIDNGWSETAEQDGHTAFAPYQILVTTVAAGTPAAGVLATDDVILGASAGTGAVPLFTSDERKSLGWAIGAAEASNGILNFKRWRAGVITDVSITLPVMGAYSDTAPYNCPKSALVMANAANSLKQKIDTSGWGGNDGRGAISALALLATGDSAYLPMLQAYARQLAPPDYVAGDSAWSYYNAIFLAEYYMLTGDTQVFQGLSTNIIYAATHSSMFGTAGHGFSNIPPPGGWVAGGTHGSMGWYGPVNSAGLVAQLAIVLGKKAGVVSPEIDPAIARAANFFSYYVNRGSIPYGEHQPYYGEHQLQGQSRTYYDHCSNGKDAQAAVMFACMGDKPVAAEYFTRMSVAGFRGEQYGHTGQGFSYLWTALGANMGGPTAAAEYSKKLRWDRDMKRRSDGSFVYEGGEQWAPGQGSSYWDDRYIYWNYPTAYYLLHAAMPLKNLYITGKGLNPASVLSTQTVSNAIWAADFTSLCASYTKTQLIAALGEWDPIVRYNAATELGTRTLTTTEVNSLITMAENPADANQREGACTALGCLKSASAVPALTRRLKDSNTWVRAKAAKALGQVSASSVAASVPDMLDAFVTNVKPTYPFDAGFDWNDPLQISNGYLAETLFNKLGNITINA
ncbi:MAG: HEAT repeat domain-containing protein, partial [Akkermansiaceae bacterium]|nr:HEAT repeat domain-containing protein [Akkermansiaceae bacterium]